MKKFLNVIINFFNKIDDNLRDMYGISNKNLGKKK
tara:strand:+ start:297 stop:401 length:105 start_codon:yes stop_codon:yes gene_type:complete